MYIFLIKISQWFEYISLKFGMLGIVPKFLLTLGIAAMLYSFNRVILKKVDETNWKSTKILTTKKVISNILRITFILILIPIWIYETKDILTFLGLFSAGLAFALKDLVSSFLGWIIINSHKPFALGDRIKVGDSIGDVIEINWFYTTIIEVTQTSNAYGQSTGRLIHIPNIKLLNAEVINGTGSFPYSWNEIEIKLSLDSNWEKAKEIILDKAKDILGNMEEEVREALDMAAKTQPIYYQNLSHTVYTSLCEGKIILTLRFICGSRSFRTLEHSIVENILIEFKKHEDIKLV